MSFRSRLGAVKGGVAAALLPECKATAMPCFNTKAQPPEMCLLEVDWRGTANFWFSKPQTREKHIRSRSARTEGGWSGKFPLFKGQAICHALNKSPRTRVGPFRSRLGATSRGTAAVFPKIPKDIAKFWFPKLTTREKPLRSSTGSNCSGYRVGFVCAQRSYSNAMFQNKMKTKRH